MPSRLKQRYLAASGWLCLSIGRVISISGANGSVGPCQLRRPGRTAFFIVPVRLEALANTASLLAFDGSDSLVDGKLEVLENTQSIAANTRRLFSIGCHFGSP